MKSFSDSVRFASPRPSQMGIVCIALVLGATMWVTGCGKKESPTPTGTQATTNNQQGVPPQVKVEVSANAEGNLPIMQQLNRAMFRYQMQNHRNPASVEELASAAGIQLPAPPPGKKYAFDSRGIVVLIDNPAK